MAFYEGNQPAHLPFDLLHPQVDSFTEAEDPHQYSDTIKSDLGLAPLETTGNSRHSTFLPFGPRKINDDNDVVAAAT